MTIAEYIDIGEIFSPVITVYFRCGNYGLMVKYYIIIPLLND